MARGQRRAFRRTGPKNNQWSVVLLQEVLLAASGQTESIIVGDTDWTFPGGETATILTVRGYLSVCAQNDLLSKQEGAVLWYIGTQDKDISLAAAPEVADTYLEERILTTGGHIFPEVEAAAAGVQVVRPTRDWDINVKTMAKIRSGTDLRFVIANRTANDIRITGVFRALLRKGGN